MQQEIEKIRKKFSGKLAGSKKMQNIVCETLLSFPKEIVDYVTENVWFVSSFDDSWGFVLKGSEIGNKFIVFFGDELFAQDKYEQKYTVAHEIGHVVLKHRNAILEPQTKAQTNVQEAQAHKFALKYVGEERGK